MKQLSRVYFSILLGVLPLLSFAQLPRLDKSRPAPIMMVDGKPFLILGGELHNSTGSDKAALKNALKEIKSYHLNTVLGYAYWEMIEPVEGQYNFELVDELLKSAREENMKVVLVWFGSWKSTASSYVPEWVKTNPKRFPRYTLADGKTLEMLSAFSEENRNADAKAYVALMQHLKEVDTQHTVIMTQVENEPGCFDNYRDMSPAGQKAWQSPMPADMVNYLKANKGKLFPALEKAWADNGYKTKGTWEEVLGKSTDQGDYKFYTEELFMAYHYSKYLNYIAAEGRKKLDLPTFCNGWLYNKRGFYPHGTINPHVLDAYRAGGTALDFYSPNVYTTDYDELFSNYTLGGNTLFIPESMLVPAGALYSIGAFNALGFAPFGIDGERTKSKENAVHLSILTATNKTLSNMTGLITSHYNSSKMRGLYINATKKEHKIELGDYQITASSSTERGGFSLDFGKSLENVGKPQPASGTEAAPAAPAPFGSVPKGIGSAIVIQQGTDEFYVVGYGVKLNFRLKEGVKFEHLGFVSIDEGDFENEKFIPRKRWNGDEQKASLPDTQLTVLKIKLYRN